MYSLLLVDDEIHILNGLYQNVAWEELGVDRVYKASLAAQALSIIAEKHIDLLITDIRMPEMDGMELASIVRRSWPYTKIIFLTGYQEFAYAHTAVQLGVFRYILKPVLYEDILSAAGEAIQELAVELEQAVRIRDMEQALASARPVMRERLIAGWLNGAGPSPLPDEHSLREYDIPLSATDWGFLVAVRLDGGKEGPEEALRAHLAVRDSARSILASDCRMLDYLNSDRITILAFVHEEARAGPMQGRVVACLETFQNAIYSALGRHCTIFWTKTAWVGCMQTVYDELKQRIARSIVLLPYGIIGPKQPGAHAVARIESLGLRPLFSTLVEQLQKERALERLDLIFHELSRCPGDNNLACLQVYHEITGSLVNDSLSRGFTLQEWAGERIDFFENIAVARSIDRFHDTARQLVAHYIDYVYSSTVTQTQSVVMAVKDAVREGLGEELSVAALAERFAYHPNYLSQMFKQETGRSLQEYIIHERMDLSKRLLSKGMPVGDVALRVGYGNVTHFSRIFKKNEGLSPKQYQQRGAR